jgi:cell division protein FtsA
MDARIGYPNEHLGKSKIDAVKSPMYATAVGLVLAGYQSLDDRMNRYLEAKQEEGGRPDVNRNNAKPSSNGQSGGGDFFKKIIDRTKGLLIDDFDDKQQNY